MPTGWRPADVILKYPVEKIDDPYSQQKYYVNLNLKLELWVWLEFIITISLMLLFFNSLGKIAPHLIIWIGSFLFISIFSFTSLMDKSRLAIYSSFIGSIIGIIITYYTLSLNSLLAMPLILFLILNPIITTTLLQNKQIKNTQTNESF
jgi:hypothetical protein